jgi:hypothetical protein
VHQSLPLRDLERLRDVLQKCTHWSEEAGLEHAMNFVRARRGRRCLPERLRGMVSYQRDDQAAAFENRRA